MSQTTTPEFGKWRSRLWPIHRFELKKLVPMILMFFLILFNYTVLRDSKDALLVGEIGNLAIPFVKIFGTSIGAIFFLIIYSKMANLLSKPKLFYSSIVPFLTFFALFGLVIYPNSAALELTTIGNWLQGALPESLGFVAECVRKWPYPLFYIMAELWGTVCISLLFWGFANDITRVSEAKRIYPVLPLFGNFGLILAGPTVALCSNIARSRGLAPEATSQFSTMLLMGVLLVSGAIIIGLYKYMQSKVLTDPRFCVDGDGVKKKDKPKMGLLQSFKYLASSRYLLCIAILVLGYGIAINLIEVTWKGQIKMMYPEKNDYLRFMGLFSMSTGIFTIFSMLFIGGNVMRRFGWTTSAMFTPVMLIITGGAFFGFVMYQNSLGAIAIGSAPLMAAVLIGAAQNILSKASKYSLFDPTKEMAYIPLDQEQKVKGKAAIDVAGARLGKSGGSAIQLGLAAAMTGAQMVPVVGIICLFVVGGWLVAAKSLGRQFADLNDKKAAEAKAATSEEAAPASA